MNTNIFVPTIINVGFQNRPDTYTGKLAYIIYYDEKCKLRKEASWQKWRDKNIPNKEFNNEPTEGFVLNKNIDGYKNFWDMRQTYIRVYDPRGFEFEITVSNLMWILENCDCVKGKGFVGKFVYGWVGKDLLLVPVDSPDYQQIIIKTQTIYNNNFIKAKDLIVGATYETLDGEHLVYMGIHPEYNTESNYYNEHAILCESVGYEKPLDNTWFYGLEYYKTQKHQTLYRSVLKREKTYWFIKLNNLTNKIVTYVSLSKKLCKMIDENCHKEYNNFKEMLKKSDRYSPINFTANKVIDLPFENFKRTAERQITVSKDFYHRGFLVGIRTENPKQIEGICIYYDPELKVFYRRIFKPNYSIYGSGSYKEIQQKFESIEEMYQIIQPVYGELYLSNGYVNERRYYYGEDG